MDAGRRHHGRDALRNASASTGNPAVTLRSVGSAGGQAAAFTYDLARSVVYTRQGNPDWAGEERDGHARRSSARTTSSSRPTGSTSTRCAIPQADEQQRLLANLVTQMNLDRTPLPRFWYLPRGEKAAVVMTGDDHGSDGGTAGRFNRLRPTGAAGLLGGRLAVHPRDVLRLPDAALIADAQATAFQAAGFEIALHLNTGCANPPRRSMRELGGPARRSSRDAWPDVPPPAHQPHPLHRVERLGDASAKAERAARHPARHELLLLARLRGCRTGPGCSPDRASRCGSPTPTARSSTSTRLRRR